MAVKNETSLSVAVLPHSGEAQRPFRVGPGAFGSAVVKLEAFGHGVDMALPAVDAPIAALVTSKRGCAGSYGESKFKQSGTLLGREENVHDASLLLATLGLACVLGTS
jgi:hypothetical protein